jgi:hypothetical protein
VLPTLIVIVFAYGMYVLFSFVLQRKGGHSRHRNNARKFTWITMAGCLIGLGFILWCGLTPDRHDQRLRLAGFLGTVYAEGWPHRVDQMDYPPVKVQTSGTGDQPVYALLHPETPSSQLEPEKKLIKPRPVRTAKKKQVGNAQEKSGKTAKVTKVTAQAPKKDKMAAKSRTKKMKRPSVKGGGPTDAG